jgi:hypothetical protein
MSIRFTFALDPTYFDVRGKVEAALRRLPLRTDGALERPLERWSDELAILVLHPAPVLTPDPKADAAAAAKLWKAWRDLPRGVRSRVISRLVLGLGDTSIGHQQALARALPATFERVALDMRDLVRPSRPVPRAVAGNQPRHGLLGSSRRASQHIGALFDTVRQIGRGSLCPRQPQRLRGARARRG